MLPRLLMAVVGRRQQQEVCEFSNVTGHRSCGPASSRTDTLMQPGVRGRDEWREERQTEEKGWTKRVEESEERRADERREGREEERREKRRGERRGEQKRR